MLCCHVCPPVTKLSVAPQAGQHGGSALVGGAGAKDTRMAQQHQVVLIKTLHVARQILNPVLHTQVL